MLALLQKQLISLLHSPIIRFFYFSSWICSVRIFDWFCRTVGVHQSLTSTQKRISIFSSNSAHHVVKITLSDLLTILFTFLNAVSLLHFKLEQLLFCFICFFRWLNDFFDLICSQSLSSHNFGVLVILAEIVLNHFSFLRFLKRHVP